MKIYTLIEDDKRPGSAFVSENGLSLYFEQDNKRILFDTGASGNFIYNATLLGIDLSKVDYCIISHAHDDHTGGLAHFLEINNQAEVYMKSTVKDDYYLKHIFHHEKAGLSSDLLEKYPERITFVDNDAKITPSVSVLSINQYRHLPQFTSLMYKKTDEGLIKDDLSHELFVTVSTKNGVIALTGCSHHGLINILMTAAKKTSDVYGVIGGFHLDGIRCFGLRRKKESHLEVRAIAKYFNQNRIKKIYTGHCTGDKPLEKLQLLSRTKKMYSGDIIDI